MFSATAAFKTHPVAGRPTAAFKTHPVAGRPQKRNDATPRFDLF